MTKYVACFVVIISLLGQSLLQSVSAEPSIGNSAEVSTMMQSQPLSAHVLSYQNEINAAKSMEPHIVKTKGLSKCKKLISQCTQLDSGHCTTHSDCHSVGLSPMTTMASSAPVSFRIMITTWSAKTFTYSQDFRPPIA
ncbi:hypothetical protein [uncultured Shewanella sp.]|uniref:hypothetical protein n=1 Tax=uncultured Shewanella sp. TaxID=173975 RepID=UPI00260CA880|nr:hypothetical protein [uncultured Shewanella sp.]